MKSAGLSITTRRGKRVLTFLHFTILSLFLVSVQVKAQVIVKFEALMKSDAVYFNWELGQNVNYQLLEVERSANQLTYTNCLTLNSSNTKLFAWDKQPLPWISYYRLKVTDANGQVTYSAVVIVMNKRIAINGDPYSSETLLNNDTRNDGTKPVSGTFLFDMQGNPVQEWKNGEPLAHELSVLAGSRKQGSAYILISICDNKVIDKRILVYR